MGGFTVAELVIASSLLAVILLTAGMVFSNFYSALRNMRAANLIYDEANFVMERIAREVRNGTIDYEEYYNQNANFFGTGVNDTYGQNYCGYSRQFYGPGPDGVYGTFDDESTGQRLATTVDPIRSPMQDRLYLIDSTGTRRTYFKKVVIGDRSSGEWTNLVGRLAMLRLVGRDNGIDHVDSEKVLFCPRDKGENDGLIDTWVCDTGFRCATEDVNYEWTTIQLNNYTCNTTIPHPVDDEGETVGYVKGVVTGVNNANATTSATGTVYSGSSFMDITPDTLDIVDIKFIITPKDDPFKAYNMPEVQGQPNVTIKLVAKASDKIAAEFTGLSPTIVLESTISARATKQIITECNMQECLSLPGVTKPCPKHTGILAEAKQECGQGAWTGCVNECPSGPKSNCYESVAAAAILNDPAYAEVRLDSLGSDGLDHNAPFSSDPRSFFEITTEMGSCDTMVDPARTQCRTRRCSDKVDNDVDGLKDTDDPDCLDFTCNNGIWDPLETCRDVGGPCYMHPELSDESLGGMAGDSDSCVDGLDNDCSYNKMIKDRGEVGWTDLTGEEQAQVLKYDEDLAGSSNTNELLIALGKGADEYDLNCVEKNFCSNDKQDPVLSSSAGYDPDRTKSRFGPKYVDDPSFLTGDDYLDSTSVELNEQCMDVGGLCDQLGGDSKLVEGDGENTDLLCHDGVDNDCDDTADELDDSCWPPSQAICGNGFWDCNLADPDEVNTNELLKLFRKESASPYCELPTLADGTTYEEGKIFQPRTISERMTFSYSSISASPLSEECPDTGGKCGDVDPTQDKSSSEIMSVIGPGLENISYLNCADKKDNDCNGQIDGNDPACCPDADHDDFFSRIIQKVGLVDVLVCNPRLGFIDCDDDPSNDPPGCPPAKSGCTDETAACAVCKYYEPGRKEVCDPVNPLVDTNCLFANDPSGVVSESDYDDPTCCEDTDNDGFGTQNAFMYESSDPTDTQCGADFLNPVSGAAGGERLMFDCKDTDPLINPNILENTKALCSDQLNNSCRYKTGVAGFGSDPEANSVYDHIDLFTDPLTDKGSFNSDCCLSAGNKPVDIYPVDAIAWDYPGLEICDDSNNLDPARSGQGSDENCNGKNGAADDYCLFSSGDRFLDNLSSTNYSTSAIVDGAARDETEGSYTLSVDQNIGYVVSSQILGSHLGSNQFCDGGTILSATVKPDVAIPAGTDIQFSFSRDLAAAQWTEFAPLSVDEVSTDFSGLDEGGDPIADGFTLRWKAKLTSDDPGLDVPVLKSVTINWTCG